MNKFEYKDPYLYRDEDNKKWCVRYSIRYLGQKNYEPLKEYGRTYFGKSLNSIKDLVKREKEFNKCLLLVEMDLKAGIDIKRPETVKKIYEEEVKEAKKYSYDANLQLYYKLKGYIDPIPKKEKTAEVFKGFHKNQFRPFLEKKGLLDDIRLITKSHLLEFMNSYYLSDDPEVKWSNNTFNNKKGVISAFFRPLVDEEILEANPVTKIKLKEADTTERFETFTKEERDLIFTYFDEKHPFMAAICRVIYYGYIRETELSRLLVEDFDLKKRQIRIHPDNAKGQKDKLSRWVRMSTHLRDAVQAYLDTFEHRPNWYIFGKKYKPSKVRVPDGWQYLFRDGLDVLRERHPDKFAKEGLSLYGLKHSGVTDFVNDNAATKSSTELLRYVQTQCRHESLEMTQKYLKKLEINIEMMDDFDFD